MRVGSSTHPRSRFDRLALGTMGVAFAGFGSAAILSSRGSSNTNGGDPIANGLSKTLFKFFGATFAAAGALLLYLAAK